MEQRVSLDLGAELTPSQRVDGRTTVVVDESGYLLPIVRKDQVIRNYSRNRSGMNIDK